MVPVLDQTKLRLFFGSYNLNLVAAQFFFVSGLRNLENSIDQ